MNINISEVKLTPMTEDSAFLKPHHMYFTQNGRKRRWDLIKVHESVAILIYNITREKIILVKQFRPAVYLNSLPENEKMPETKINTVKFPHHLGMTLELCAGIVDKPDKTLEEIACEEVEEECGYKVAASALKKVISYRSSVGVSGDRQTVFYVEVTDDMKTSEGGGNDEEGEIIEVIELSIDEAKEYMARPEVLSPGGFLFALQWFFNLKNIN